MSILARISKSVNDGNFRSGVRVWVSVILSGVMRILRYSETEERMRSRLSSSGREG